MAEVAISRRAALVLGTGAALSACGAVTSAPSPPRTSTGSPAPATTSPATAPVLPVAVRWHPGPGKLVPACKVAAVRHVESFAGPRSRIEVLDAQYGGLLATTASVLVVCRSWRLEHGAILTGGHTYDVRLSLSDGGWQVTTVHPSVPGPPSKRLSTAARHVLASSRLLLPPAAHADIASGQVHDAPLEAMLTLARTRRLGISVVRSGHPLLVFGTDRPSDHPQGRAFDIHTIDGEPVVAPTTPRSLVVSCMEALAAAGSYNVGGPYLLGAAPQYFSDATHHDHVHAGFVA